MFKSALDSGDKAQLQAVLDELNVKAMLEARQGGGVFGGRETKGQQDNGGKKKSSKKKKKSLRDGQKKVCSPFEVIGESFAPEPRTVKAKLSMNKLNTSCSHVMANSFPD